MTRPHVSFEPIKGFTPKQEKPRILFVKGIPDDGMIKIGADTSGEHSAETMKSYASASILRQHIPGTLQHFVNIPGMANETLVLAGNKNQSIKFSIPQVLVNCMTDADRTTKALGKLDEIITNIKTKQGVTVPVVNPPAAVLRTTRDGIYEQFKNLPGLAIPRTLRIAPTSVADVVQHITTLNVRLPFLMREVGRHSGIGMQHIADWSPENLLKLERYAYDGREFYITEWVDFKSADGLYRKERFLCVGGTVIPRHRIITGGWETHLRWRKELMNAREELRKEEETFLYAPLEQTLNADARTSLRNVYETLGLDYFGIDGSIRTDGSLLVFEINAAFNAMSKNTNEIYAYTNPAIEAVVAAFDNTIIRTSGLKRQAA